MSSETYTPIAYTDARASSTTVIASQSIFVAMASVAVAGRFLSRRVNNLKVEIDDWMSLTAVVI